MSDRIVLQGEVSLIQSIDGDADLTLTADGDVGTYMPILPVLQENKTATPTEQAQTITPDPQFNGLRKVTVNAIPSDYVGSAIVHDPEIIVNGASVNVPAGYQTEDRIAIVQTAHQATPTINVNGTNITATSTQLEGYVAAGTKTVTATVPSGSVIVNNKAITANPTISVGNDGKITASVSASSSVSPTVSEGYVTGGTSGTVTVSGQNTTQMTTQPGATITPTESQQTAVAAGKYTTGAVKVGAIPSNYVGSGIVHDPTPTVSGATVNIPTGYYSQNSSKSVQTAQQATPVITVNGGNITATATQSEGYVQAGTETATATIPTVQQAVPVMSVNGATVTATATQSAGLVNAGTETASITIASGTVSVDNQNITVNPIINVDSNGEITASVSGSETLTATVSEGYVDTSTPGTAAISGTATSQLSTMAGQTVTPATSAQTLNTTGKYMIGNVVVNAMPTGTAGTPTAAKGAVVNNSVTVTPSVINSAGYISGGTITGTGVSVSASELVSGTLSVTQNGIADVTNYAGIDVNVSGGGGTVSGDKQIIADGTYDVSDKATATYIWPMPFRAYINVTNYYWAFYNDSSTSFCFMIESDKTYTLKWDSDITFNLYRVAFTKTTNAPSTNSTAASYRRDVFKADGTEGLEQNGFESELTFKITDSSLKMCVVQIQGTTTIWNTGTVFAWFEELMQHLTITVE